MKKIISLVRASMTSDMNIFKIKTKSKNKKSNLALLLFISLCFMFSMWSYANMLFEQMAPLHLQYIVISLFVFLISIATIIEGIYKSGSLMFNCKDDQMLLSLPIKRRVVLFLRIFKFYVFELLFNSLFLIPLIIAYIRWADVIDWTFYLTSIVMIFFLPIIPIIISCILGVITSSISSHFKFKNLIQILLSMILLVGILILSYNLNGIINYLAKHAASLNEVFTKIYYPAGLYASLTQKFNLLDLLVFIVINIVLLVITIYLLSKVYFKINSRLKNVTTTKKVSIDKLTITSRKPVISMVKKELNTFFKTPVFIINAGFALVLYLIAAIVMSVKFNSILPELIDPSGMNIPKDLIFNNMPIFFLILIIGASFMTSITNSVISLEGKSINILKALPISTKDILLYKIYAALTLTTPVLIIGDIILFIRFKINILSALFLLILSVMIPLVSHFIGIIINLKFPKLVYDSSTEVVKQSTSSFLAVLIGMILLIVNVILIFKVFGKINTNLLLLIILGIYILIDILLYLYLTKKSVKDFNNLSV